MTVQRDDPVAYWKTLVKTMAETQETLLRGWPECLVGPTEEEAYNIVSIHHELMIQDSKMTDERAWYTAGQIVARIRKDTAEREE